MGFTFETLRRVRKHRVQVFSPLSVFSSVTRCQIHEPRGLLWIALLERQTEGTLTAQHSLHSVLLIKGIQMEMVQHQSGRQQFSQTKQQKHTHHKALGMTTYLGETIIKYPNYKK